MSEDKKISNENEELKIESSVEQQIDNNVSTEETIDNKEDKEQVTTAIHDMIYQHYELN